MDHKKKKRNIAFVMFVIGLAAVMLLQVLCDNHPVDKTSFLSAMEIMKKEDSVGANIWLKQSVHGENGIKYRYVVETDCPNWDFETRYVTDTPLDWVEETSAVETIVYDVQIRYEGAVYASGQYYTVPLLDNVSSESLSEEEWEENLITQAYQTYVQEKKMEVKIPRLWQIVIGMVFVIFLVIIIQPDIIFGKEKRRKDEAE